MTINVGLGTGGKLEMVGDRELYNFDASDGCRGRHASDDGWP
ncbi:hypothetical protein [Bradyrhizobium semiaridum]|nr:hypothetical protein [Bradyrhizobium semiaridum]